MLRYLTAGESHGKCLTAILDGVPANLVLSEDDINEELRRRQVGYGRGNRMSIERDTAEITSGVRFGKTIGAPVAMIIKNRDWQNWKEIMNVWARGNGQGARGEEVTRPRPGHADLAGVLKYRQYDIRNILERSSARETAARVAVGAVCKKFLDEFGIKVMSWVVEIGGVRSQGPAPAGFKRGSGVRSEKDIEDIFKLAEVSDVRCPDKVVAEKMRRAIDRARKKGDSIGGIFEVAVTGVPPGLGSHVQWDRKLDGNLAKALMSIQAIKGVETGMGFYVAGRFGSEVHDEIFYRSQKKNLSSVFWPLSSGFYRKTNNAGGIEGGMSNGEPIILRAAMKPIPTLYKPLRSVDIKKKKAFAASVERSDICAVPAASVIGEAVVAFEIANAFVEKFGGDSIDEIKRNYKGYIEYLRKF
ncbi:MAG: chorismate synthase [Deltaproteobacteria bacterium GWC2_42_51]|nr:MAG: chorismate synthase [Deltaproteobacteria bacterium GWC2_42_51]OGP38673.1 MAG: chorismate synthase [Deltaproteobacteria bacterium GWD2_42_10]OGQ25559.1 MAG: chorismate synthase [Deltaproteobacteria bacterium RIFCSPHIGHO2_02_FULL_42_44]OGQ37322.1 MAG: chorismate synthase [Deltaproteobacteria bacterium RIFCSPLOWO2_02_FULL_42_39]OGQ68832.1 MAG: chorismate synthase [Deltaproteobacteria bacterium RIFCSPLOWO2_12_FULL_42_16]OGQ75476.1 MAG: chorismate synthase [Deltaproteobacteria bacterium RIF